MKNVLRLASLLALCFALVAGSTSMAVARGQAAALSRGGATVVICSGYGVMTIALDQRGDPLRSVHPCPDCLAGNIACLIPSLSTAPQHGSTYRKATALPFEASSPPRMRHVPQARDPPLSI